MCNINCKYDEVVVYERFKLYYGFIVFVYLLLDLEYREISNSI